MLIIENSTCYILCSYMFYLEKHGIKVFACWEHERVRRIHVLNVLVEMKIYNIPGLNVEFPGLPVDQVCPTRVQGT